MKYSIKTQLISIFAWIITFTMLLCWGLNNFFLKDVYFKEKQNAFESYYESVSQCLNDGHFEQLKTELSKMRYRDNITFIILKTDLFWWSSIATNLVSKTEVEEMTQRLGDNINTSQTEEGENGQQLVRVIKKESSYTIQEKIYPVSQTSYMECYGFFEDNIAFMMSTPISWIQDSVEISNQFLFYTCLAALILAIVLISISTRGITKPLLQLADLSKRMAKLDFESRYEGKQVNEVAILGNSMNQMADQLKETIEELQEANKQLKQDIEEKIQIDEMRKEFLSNVSHELKTPIALIQGYAEGLQEAINDDPESRDFYCEVIIDEADKMNRMVKKLLTLNHLEFGQDALSVEVFDLAEMMDTVLANNELIAQKKGIVFERNYTSPCIVAADEFKIEEVFTNYLSNAMNHADGERNIKITVDVGVGEDKEQVKVTVFNTGTPIPQDSLEKVWIKFFKVDKARTREYGGSGIGLSIVKAIMDAHNQPYGVYNTEDGVAFWFCLKRAKNNGIERMG